MLARSLFVCLAVGILLLPMTHGLPPAPSAAVRPMQADDSNPLWAALRQTGRTPAQWATLLTSDADANGQTDFLDLVAALGHASGLDGTPVELLVRGQPAALARLSASHPDAVVIAGQDALFLTAPLSGLGDLRQPGVDLVVWEPRAVVSNSQNPAAGTPANMRQISIHQGGGAWSGSPSYTGSGVTIAILDTGADPNHQALDGGKISAWKDCTSAVATAYDNHGHGTHVASIAAGDDGTDFRGIAYQASVNAVKILDGSGSGTLAWFQCGINWVGAGGPSSTKTADVASMSAGLAVPPLALTTLNGGPTDLFGWDGVAAVLYTKNIPFSVAAGNWVGTGVEFLGLDETTHAGVNGVNQVSSPGYSNRVLTVGAVDEDQAPTTFTALGPGSGTTYKPDVAAMGFDTWGALAGQTSWYAQWSGTSMATPLVGGALALLYQKHPSATTPLYFNAIRNGAVQGCIWSATSGCTVTEAPSPNFVMGWGVLKAQNSLALV